MPSAILAYSWKAFLILVGFNTCWGTILAVPQQVKYKMKNINLGKIIKIPFKLEDSGMESTIYLKIQLYWLLLPVLKELNKLADKDGKVGLKTLTKQLIDLK